VIDRNPHSTSMSRTRTFSIPYCRPGTRWAYIWRYPLMAGLRFTGIAIVLQGILIGLTWFLGWTDGLTYRFVGTSIWPTSRPVAGITFAIFFRHDLAMQIELGRMNPWFQSVVDSSPEIRRRLEWEASDTPSLFGQWTHWWPVFGRTNYGIEVGRPRLMFGFPKRVTTVGSETAVAFEQRPILTTNLGIGANCVRIVLPFWLTTFVLAFLAAYIRSVRRCGDPQGHPLIPRS
jgi:hypothetical protein